MSVDCSLAVRLRAIIYDSSAICRLSHVVSDDCGQCLDRETGDVVLQHDLAPAMQACTHARTYTYTYLPLPLASMSLLVPLHSGTKVYFCLYVQEALHRATWA